MRKFLILSGVVAAIVYAGTVILGGAIRPGYSHLTQPISELVAAGAPNRALLSPLFILYNLLLGAFGIGVFLNARSSPQGRRLGMAGAVALIVVGLAGLLLELFFPQDPGGARAATTTTGNMHIAVAGIAALGTMLAIVLMALWFRNDTGLGMRRYVVYSLITVAVLFVSGGFGAAGAASGGSEVFGLVERITIGSFIQWLFVVGLAMYSAAQPAMEVQPASASA